MVKNERCVSGSCVIGRVLRTGLLGRARALLHGLGPKGEYPSRCWFGHDWKLSNGVGYTVGNSRMAIFFSKDCRRCGKHKDGSMLV